MFHPFRSLYFIGVDDDVDGGGDGEQEMIDVDDDLPPERRVVHLSVDQQVIGLLRVIMH